MSAKEWLLRVRGIKEMLEAVMRTNVGSDVIVNLKQIQAEVLNVISRIDDHVLAALLVERYINSMRWEDVARAIHYSTSYTQRILHPKALREVSKILELKE